MREIAAAAVIAALLGPAARAEEPVAAPAKASTSRNRDAAARKARASRANDKKADATKTDGSGAAKPAGAEAGQRNPDPCKPVKPCPID